MPKLNITGEERKSKELPDSFHDPDMSEEEYNEKIKNEMTVVFISYYSKNILITRAGLLASPAKHEPELEPH